MTKQMRNFHEDQNMKDDKRHKYGKQNVYMLPLDDWNPSIEQRGTGLNDSKMRVLVMQTETQYSITQTKRAGSTGSSTSSSF